MGKNKQLQYMLYGTVCIVLIITVLICFWWLLQKPYTKEDFIVPAPYLVMAAISTDNKVYYADVDVPISPKWIKMELGQTGDIAGSYGKLYVVGDGGGVVRYSSYDSSSQTEFTSKQNIKQISVDDDGTILGSDTSIYTFPSPTGSVASVANRAVSTVSIRGGAYFAVGTDKKLYYYSSLTSPGIERNPPGTSGTITDVSYDGAVCALQDDGTLWCADSNVGGDTANWKKQGTQTFSQISLKDGRLVGVGKDRHVYYSNTYDNPKWTRVPLQEHDIKGLPKTGTLAFRKVIMFYPTLDARRKRYTVAGQQCGKDEQQIGDFCYAPCSSGRTAVGTRCPYRRKHTPAIPSCQSGEYINGSCYLPCPDNTTTAAGQLCLGKVSVKRIEGKNPNVSPPSYSCGDGTIRARYVRIRPTNIGTVNNNKLCISKIVVKDKDGNVLSLPSAAPSIQSTIGSITGKFIENASIPVTAVKTVNIRRADSSTTSLKVYVATHGTGVIMVADDNDGTAKYYNGPLDSWTNSYWDNTNPVHKRSDKQYVLTLHAKPVQASASDGTCVDKPIGGMSCPDRWSTYLSSNKYDLENDGGRISRSIKTYWDLDLGAVLPIRTIEFTGCNYVPATGPTNSSIDERAVSEPNADQITGMRIQLLESSNLPTTEPIDERSLGPEMKQVLTFSYLTKQPGVDDTCYDACPKINGVQSIDGGQQTCIAASGGVTSRSVTRPIKLADPVCSLPVNANGTPYKIPAQRNDGSQSSYEIGNWVLNPTNPAQALSCDNLPESVLMPLENTYNIPLPETATTSPSTIRYFLQRPDNTLYTVTDPLTPYKCVVPSDAHCTKYNVDGAIYKYRNGLCMRMDVSPDFKTNDEWWDGGEFTVVESVNVGVGKGKVCGGAFHHDDGCCCRSDITCATGLDFFKYGCTGGDSIGKLNREEDGGARLACPDDHPDRIDGLCYRSCPASHPHHLPGMPYLCTKSPNLKDCGNKERIGELCATRCPAGYSRDNNSKWCHNDKVYPDWGIRKQTSGKGVTDIWMTLFRGPRTLFDIIRAPKTGKNALVSSPPENRAYTAGISANTLDIDAESVDDIKVPVIQDINTLITDPRTFPAQCKCLNRNGTVNTEAYIYNNKCVKCADPNELFYAKGAISSKFEWSEEYKNKFLSIYDDGVKKAIDQKPFTSLNDAKTMCETDILCKGITYSYNKAGTAYYYLRAGTVLKGKAPRSGGSAGSENIISSATAGSAAFGSSGDDSPTRDSSWVKGASGSTKVVVGLRRGTDYSTEDIPSAFADDYISPVARGSSVFRIIPATLMTLINSMANDILQAASAWTSFQNSVQNPNTYYQLIGVERQLSAASKPSDNGICVAPCDPEHSLHDPIQMIRAQYAANTGATGTSGGGLYVLYGTTCHDATQKIISKPSLPAIYTPQIGADCRSGYDLNTGGSCMEECDSNSIDSGSSCANNSIRRPSIEPRYTCPSNLILKGGVCLHPCEDGYAEDGDYCEPIATKVNLPSTIKCTQTPYTYSTKYYGSRNTPIPTSVTKWLCDSEDDQTMLLEGPTGSSIIRGTSSYVNKNDVVCYADDASTGMYYCQTVYDAINNPDNTKIENHSTTCDSMTKAYFDLSNNLTSLISARTTANNASAQMMAIKGTLEKTIGKMCGTGSGSGSGSRSVSASASASSSGTCNTLRTLLNSLNSNINSGSGAISGVLSPINVAIASRDNLVRLLQNAKCCSNVDDGYPWC